VSGDVTYLQGGPEIESLVRAAGLVVEHAGVRTAVIGGLAVACRLAVPHRATGDVDVVSDEPAVVTEGGAAENLVAARIARRDDDGDVVRVFVENTKVEIIETTALDPDDVASVEPDMARLFVLAHRWGLESATPLHIRVAGSEVEIEVPVARSASLVAMKVHAIQDRHDDLKRASDAWDLFRLIGLTSAEPDFSRDFANAPDGLVELVGDGIERVFRADVTRTRRWIRAYGDAAWVTAMSDEALAEIADTFEDVVH